MKAYEIGKRVRRQPWFGHEAYEIGKRVRRQPRFGHDSLRNHQASQKAAMVRTQ
jgi:hypothetical protein